MTVDLPAQLFAAGDRDTIKRRFDEVHAVRYGTSAPDEPAELVSLRTTVSGLLPKPPMVQSLDRGSADPAPPETRRIYFSETGDFVATPVYRRADLGAGAAIEGPAVIEEEASTTLLLPGDRLGVDAYGNLRIRVGSGGR